MKKTYFEIDEDFNKIIQQRLKDIKNIKLIPTGWTNIVFEVETAKNNYFFRFPRDEFWARTIVKDYEFAKYIYNKTDFNTVQLRLFYDNERPYTMHTKIEGTPLAEKMNNLSEEEVKNISDEIAKFMFQLHNIKYDKKQIFTINNIGLNLSEFLDELLNKHVSKEDMKFWNAKDKKELNETCLVHGDLNSSNVLLDANNHVTAIIDFGFAGFGNKYDDIARIIGRCPQNFKESIVKSYENYSMNSINEEVLGENIKTWSNIDQSYINYLRKIGIY